MKTIYKCIPKRLFATLMFCALMLNTLPYQDVSAQQDTERLPGYGLSNPVYNDSVSTWDCIYFGHYWQIDTNKDGTANKEDEKVPIKWRVLSVDGDDVFLLSDQNLVCRPFKSITSDDRYGVTWETSSIRSWLNGYDASRNICEEDYTNDNFISDAFNGAEQAAIADTAVVANDNPTVYPDRGNDTVDKLFLLSPTEACKEAHGLDSRKARMTTNTAFAGAGGNTRWMLRVMGETLAKYERVCCIDIEGRLRKSLEAPTPSELECMIRPALHLNLSSLDSNSNLVWSYAGKINSNGEEIEAELPKPGLPTSSPTAETPEPATDTPEPTAAAETPSVQTPPAVTTPPGGLSNPVWNGSVSTWDCIYFGHYWQNDTNKDGTANKNDEKEPIKWRVLSVDGDDVFLLSDQNLVCRPFKSLTVDDRYGVTWETSSIRSWLNGYDASCNICEEDYTDNNFITDAFNGAEQAAIANTAVVANDNPTVYPDRGNDTVDKLFLLSPTEIGRKAYGFESTWNKTKTRVTTNTAFAHTYNTRWMLRVMGETTPTYERVCCIDAEGRFWRVGGDAPTPSELECMIRPALHLNLSSLDSDSNLVWSYAGKINSNGQEIEAELPKPGLPTSSPSAGTPKPTTEPSEDDGPIEITKISLPVSYTKLRVGDTYQIEADIIPANATDKTLTYESSDTSVLSVSETGQIEAIKEGTATIILKSANGKNNGILVSVEGTRDPSEQTPPPVETTPPAETTAPAETTPPAESTPPAKTPPIEVTRVSLPVTGTTLHIGDTYQIEAAVVPANATDKTLTYESSDTSVASVSETGEIEAKNPGTATVTVASSNGKTAKLQVKVETETIDVEKVMVSTNKMTMGVGEKVQLEASVYPENASNKTLTYKTSNNKVTVNMLGKITAKKTGKCQITISSSNNKKAVVTVTVKKKPGKIRLNKKSKTLKVGKQFQIKPKLPKGTASYQITYTSKKKSVADVSRTGKVIAMKKGTTVITVKTYNGKKATIRIRVK